MYSMYVSALCVKMFSQRYAKVRRERVKFLLLSFKPTQGLGEK